MRPPRRAAVAAGVLAALAGAGVRASEPSLFDHGAPMIREIQRRFGDDVRVLNLGLWPGEARIEIQDPLNPAHVDRYSYSDGSLVGPEPVPVGRNRRELEARLFHLREVHLSVLPVALSAAPGAVQAEDGRVTHALLERSEGYNTDYTSWSPPLWRVLVEGPRGGGYVEHRLDGKRVRVMRW